MSPKAVEEMTEEEKREAFDKFLKNRASKQKTNTAKKEATKALIKAHKPEYDRLVKAAGGTPKAD